MQVKIAENGPTLSRIVMGVWKWGIWGHQLSTADQQKLIEDCLEAGITTFDHADIYGDHTAEEEFGAVLAANPALRDQMQIVTKCGIRMPSAKRDYQLKTYDTRYEHIIWSAEQSLKALRTDYLDLLLIHRPSPLMHPDEVSRAFDLLKASGKVKHFGVSNFTPSQFRMLASVVSLVTNQVEASLLHLDPFIDGTFDLCLEYHIKPMVWSPLGSGKLFGQGDVRVDRINAVTDDLVKHYEASADQIYLAWLLKHPAGILPVLGTARADRVRAATASLQINLSDEDWFRLWKASTGEEIA